MAQLFSLGSMSTTIPILRFLKVGAWICLLPGLYVVAILVGTIVTSPTTIIMDWPAFVVGFIYSLLAFIPFFTFVCPLFKSSRKTVLLGVALLEILVVGLLLLAALYPPYI